MLRVGGGVLWFSNSVPVLRLRPYENFLSPGNRSLQAIILGKGTEWCLTEQTPGRLVSDRIVTKVYGWTGGIGYFKRVWSLVLLSKLVTEDRGIVTWSIISETKDILFVSFVLSRYQNRRYV